MKNSIVRMFTDMNCIKKKQLTGCVNLFPESIKILTSPSSLLISINFHYTFSTIFFYLLYIFLRLIQHYFSHFSVGTIPHYDPSSYIFPIITLHLNISATGNFSEVLLLFEGLVHLVVCHAETAQTGLNGVQCLCKNDKLGHVWNADDLSVQLRGKANRLLDLSAVYQPEPKNMNET